MPLRRTGGLAICVGAMLAIVDPQAVGALPDAGLVNVARSADVAETTVAYHVSVDDYDRDGRDDFLLNRRWKVPMRLYRNAGRGALSRTIAPTSASWTASTANGAIRTFTAGRTSIARSALCMGRRTKKNELWIQQADGTFVDRAASWKVTDPFGRGRQVAFFNLNGDRYPDLFVGNDYPRQDGKPSPNRVFVNRAARATAKRSSPA